LRRAVASDILGVDRMISPASYRIVSAEDDEIVARLIAATLETGGYHVESAPNPEVALRRTNGWETVDLLVTDYAMPGSNGLALVEEARARGFRGKVILFAGSISSDVREHAASLDVDRVVPKPGASGELLTTVRALLPSQTNAKKIA
jgi:CheY-like chemotaxis protein